MITERLPRLENDLWVSVGPLNAPHRKLSCPMKFIMWSYCVSEERCSSTCMVWWASRYLTSG